MAKARLPDCVLEPMTAARQRRCMDLLWQILSEPTAPFVEHRVLGFVRDFAAKRGLRCSSDRYGNLLVTRARVLPRRGVVIVAHADHPGFVARRMVGRGRLLADWHGGVEAEYFVGARVRFHPAEGRVARGVIREIVKIDRTDTRQRVQQVLVEVRREVPAGCPGSWDLPAFRRKGRRIEALGCDDVAGLGAALAALDLLATEQTRHDAGLLVTRAEEAGLVGISAAAFAHSLPVGASFVSVECSQAQPEAPQGAGPIVRVGDRVSVFDPDLTDWLCRIAGQIAKGDKVFRWQRKLMAGGTCEASVLRAAGYRATGMCVPLGHYHNRDTARKQIASEYIDRDDWLGLVRLIAAVAASSPDVATAAPLAKHFGGWLNRYKTLLKDPLAGRI